MRFIPTPIVLSVVAVIVSACSGASPSKMERYLPELVPTAYMLFYPENASKAENSNTMLREVSSVLFLTDAQGIINGFRSSVEGEEVDQTRVDKVSAFLLKQGVPVNKFQATARGVAPVSSLSDDETASRRVEIIIRAP